MEELHDLAVDRILERLGVSDTEGTQVAIDVLRQLESETLGLDFRLTEQVAEVRARLGRFTHEADQILIEQFQADQILDARHPRWWPRERDGRLPGRATGESPIVVLVDDA